MPGESFKFLMVRCLAGPVDFRRSQVSQVSTGSCSLSDILTNQDGFGFDYQTNLVVVTSWLVTAWQASLPLFVDKIHYEADSDDLTPVS